MSLLAWLDMPSEREEEDVITDDLFVGLTRPTTMWGIPYHAFVVEFMLTTLVFLAIGNPLYLLLAVPIHGILYLISASNPRIFSEIVIWIRVNSNCVNARFWGGTSFSPRNINKWHK
jgi:type IV secretion system protein VirB3